MPFSGNLHITQIVRVDGDGNQCQIECVGGDQGDPDLRLSKCAQLVDAKLKQGYPAQTALVQNITPPALVPEVDESATVTPNPFEPIPSAKEFGYWCLGIGVILFILGSGKRDRRYSSGVRGGIPILLSLGFLLVVVGLIFMFFPVELLVGGILFIIVIVLTIVFGKAYTRNRDVRLLREENEFRLAQALSLVDDHREELTIRRRQLTITKSFNLVDESKWVDEQKLFINELIFQRLGSLSAEILTNVLTHINDVTSDFDSEEDKYHDKMDGVDYERFVAHKLDGLGWTTRITKGSGDQGIDVIARKQSTTVVIQCKRLSDSVGNGAVQEVIAGKIFERADYAAVVSNARFSNSAKQLASATGTLLLHHNELTRLDLVVNKP
ncbi:MAG: restriction endonuclease [Sulfuriferula sp.]